jgi:hypothetical protein
MAMAIPAYPQSSPIDLMDLSLEELLNVHIIGRVHSASGPSGEDDTRWGFRYRYVLTMFEDYKDGSSDLSIPEVLEQFPVVPNEIKQCAHVFQVTYDASEDMSLFAMLPYIRQSTDHVRRMGDPFTIDSEGMGDVLVQATKSLQPQGEHHITLTGGLSLPTGSIDERGDTPRGKNSQLPYTMQIGSGTFDVVPGVTYTRHSDRFHLGGQLKGTLRLGKSGRDYSLGDRLLLTAWLQAEATESLSATVKVAFQHWEKIEGADPVLDPTIAPVADPSRYGGQRATVNLGLDLAIPVDGLDGHHLEVDAGMPFYEHLNGPQPGQEWTFSVGWRTDI